MSRWRLRKAIMQGVLFLAAGAAIALLLHNTVVASSLPQQRTDSGLIRHQTLADNETDKPLSYLEQRVSTDDERANPSAENATPAVEKLALDIKHSVPHDNHSIVSVESVIQARISHIHSLCAVQNYPDFAQSNSYYFPSYHFTWIPVYKAGSTTWKKFFIETVLPRHADFHIALLSHYHLSSIRGSGGATRRRVYRREPEGSLRFTIVRHPLSRLISHYRKTVDSGPDEMGPLADLWVAAAIQKSREDPHWQSEQRERYERELGLFLRGNISPEESPGNPYLSPPTFPEFISFILHARAHKDPRGDNVHWRPAAIWTDICQMQPDIVTKLENEREELPYLLERLGLSPDLLERFLTRENASSGHGEVAGREVEEHIRELSEEEQRELNEMYRIDYEFFGYEPVYT